MPKPNVREKLVEGGLQTFQSHGFHGCAVQDITTAAGVPKGSFYNHFESKDALALVALDTYWNRSESRVALLADTSVDPVKRLRRYFVDLSKFIAESDFQQGCLIGNFSSELSAHSAPVREKLAALYTTWESALEGCIREALDKKLVRVSLSAKEISAYLLNSWEGAVLRAKVQQDRSPLALFLKVVFSSLFETAN